MDSSEGDVMDIEQKYPSRQAWMDAVAASAGREPPNAPTKPYWHDPMRDELIVALHEARTALEMMAFAFQTTAADRVVANIARVIEKAKAQS